MSLTKVSYSMITGTPANILDYGADPTGIASSYAAIVAALAASNNVIIPPGNYLIDQQINISGNKIISGFANNDLCVSQHSTLNFTAASGNCFSATTAEYEGIYIGNLRIVGGNGAYAIRSSRPQSNFESINMETFNGGGIQLFEAGTGSQASWGTAVKNCKWVGPNSPTAYFAFDVTVNGGHVLFDSCTAIRGSIGLNINQCQAIRVFRCSFNLQTSQGGYNYSSLPVTSQCGIRLSGAGYKQGVEIDSCYIEACTYGLYVEKCEGLFVHGNYIADVGISSNYASVFLKGSTAPEINVDNVLIESNSFYDTGNNMYSVDVGDRCANVAISNNYMRTQGTNSVNIRNNNTFFTYQQNNSFFYNPFSGKSTLDNTNTLVNTNFQNGGFFTYSKNSVLCVNNTWYDLGVVLKKQAWQVNTYASDSPGIIRRQDMIYIDTSNVAFVKNIFLDSAFGANVLEVQVSSGVIQFRNTLAPGDVLLTCSAIRLA